MAAGLHHVTAIAGPAARNLAFQTGVLGQRLIKRTVNFDDPGTYHLYYGDAAAAPGSILTFFPWETVAPGRLGIGETGETAFRVPRSALPFWAKRLAGHGAAVDPLEERFGDPVLPFRDPDGLRLALVGLAGLEAEPFWPAGDLKAEQALRGFFGVTLVVRDPPATAALLTDVFGFAPDGREGARGRFAARGTAMGGVVDLKGEAGLAPGRQGGGSVHHVAVRAADDDAQSAMVRRLHDIHRVTTTEQKDRTYFRSVYMREPNGIIVEIATDGPGFAVDEPADALGRGLTLPPSLEARRTAIEAGLPRLA